MVSDAHKGQVGAIGEVFQGAARRRCVVHLMRDCVRAAGGRELKRRVARVLAPVFRAKDPATAVAMYHVARGMLRSFCPKAAEAPGEAEPDAPAYPGFPPSHWGRLSTNNVQERANREIKRRSRVMQVFPSGRSPMRLAGAVMCDMDEARAGRRHFSGAEMRKLWQRPEGKKRGRPAPAGAGVSSARRAL